MPQYRVLRFEGDRIREVEVYFGWSLPAGALRTD